MSSADFFKIYLLKRFFQEYHWNVKQFVPDQAQRIVGPDLGSNCLPRLSADNTGRLVKLMMIFPTFLAGTSSLELQVRQHTPEERCPTPVDH